MAETGRKAEDTDFCPYCGKGRLAKDNRTNLVSCPTCGAYYDRGILYRGMPSNTYASTVNLRQRRWHNKARLANAAEKNIAFALPDLKRISEENGLSHMAEEYSIETYRKAILNNLARGRSTDCMVATSVYAACRKFRIPRTLEEISDSCGISKKELGRTYRFLTKALKLSIEPARPQDYARRYCLSLNLSQKTCDFACSLLDNMVLGEHTSGLGPKGVAAGAVYISSHKMGEGRSQSEVASVAEISEVTLRCRYKKMADALGIVLEF